MHWRSNLRQINASNVMLHTIFSALQLCLWNMGLSSFV